MKMSSHLLSKFPKAIIVCSLFLFKLILDETEQDEVEKRQNHS